MTATLAALVLGVPAAAGASSGGAGAGGTPAPVTQRASGPNPFTGRAMWIWELPASNGGNLSSVVSRAHAHGIRTLMIKSSDGSGMWSQFTPALVSALHANGLRVCAWQYVYGSAPGAEARAGATAVKDGADCLIIDAEAEYEGKYVQAQNYVSQLRKQIGNGFPVALAGFPYVDYHPAFPYSIFLGPGGAQYNVPQMYWQDIGVSVDAVYAHTYRFNRVFGRPIFPLGQIYNSPSPAAIVRFRELSLAYGATGVSWWDWQEGGARQWKALAQPLGSLAGFAPVKGLASVGRGAAGDLVVWAQEHLVTAGQRIPVDGSFGAGTQSAVRRLQRAHGLAASGLIDATTWQILLRFRPAYVHWALHKAGIRAASIASADGTTMVPASASRPAVRNELAGHGGRGRPSR